MKYNTISRTITRTAAAVAITGALALAAGLSTGCQTAMGSDRQLMQSGLPESAQVVGGGASMQFTAPAEGTIYVVDTENNRVLYSSTVDHNEEVQISAEEIEERSPRIDRETNWGSVRLFYDRAN